MHEICDDFYNKAADTWLIKELRRKLFQKCYCYNKEWKGKAVQLWLINIGHKIKSIF